MWYKLHLLLITYITPNTIDSKKAPSTKTTQSSPFNPNNRSRKASSSMASTINLLTQEQLMLSTSSSSKLRKSRMFMTFHSIPSWMPSPTSEVSSTPSWPSSSSSAGMGSPSSPSCWPMTTLAARSPAPITSSATSCSRSIVSSPSSTKSPTGRMQNRGKNYAGQSTTSWMWGISRGESSSSKEQSRSSSIGTTSRACTCSAG